jgi:succinyl-CoA synthetase beta subunit
MRLHEYQAKRILSRFGVPVPRGEVATSVGEVRQISDELGERVVLKAQVLTGGRGRAGGVRLANEPEEAERLAGQMFGMDIHGFVASKVLVDEAIDVEREIYLGISIGRMEEPRPGGAQPVIVASAAGGAELSEIAHQTPEHIYRRSIDPLLGLRVYQARELAYDIGLGREQSEKFVSVAVGLWRAFSECDATLVEANPLVLSPDGDLISLNSKVIVDDSALYRHRDLLDLRDESQETRAERLARRYGIDYVRLGGHVGCLSNGAGLAMATMDLLRLHGVKAANFVDLGAGAQAAKVVVGLRLALTNSIHAVLVNVFAALTQCDEIARGILAARSDIPIAVPVVVRLEGTNAPEGRALLAECANVHLTESMADAVEQVMSILGQLENPDRAQ